MTSAATAVAPAAGPCHGCGVLLGSLLAACDDQRRIQSSRVHGDPEHSVPGHSLTGYPHTAQGCIMASEECPVPGIKHSSLRTPMGSHSTS